MRPTFAPAAACAILLATHAPAVAQSVEDFYRGKTITIYVGTGMGAGAVSAYPMGLAPVLRLPQANFQPARFNWIGSPSRTVSIAAVWNASTPVRSIQDAMQREIVVGATSIAQDTGIFPRALNRVLGTRFKIV